MIDYETKLEGLLLFWCYLCGLVGFVALAIIVFAPIVILWRGVMGI